MADQTGATKTGVAALERGLAILAAFKAGDRGLTLTEIAARTGFYKSTILRLCVSLEKCAVLRRSGEGRYYLGPALFQMGRIYQSGFDVGDIVGPVLRDLAEQSGESASFYVPDSDGDICLHRVQSPQSVRDAGIQEGDRFPRDECATSEVIRAHEGNHDGTQDSTDGELLVIARGRRVPGAAAIACPVFGVDQTLAGVLQLSGPQARFGNDAVTEMKSMILPAASALTRHLGGTFPA